MYFLSVIFLTFILLCYGDSERLQEVFGSGNLYLPTGRDHLVVGSFSLYGAILKFFCFYEPTWTEQVTSFTDRINYVVPLVTYPRSASDPKVETSLSNFAFINNGFELTPYFRDFFTTQLRGHISRHNFADTTKTSDEVNEIIAKETKTSRTFRPDDFTDLVMILANVFEFKAPWTYPFRKSDTTLETDATGQRSVFIMHGQLRIPFTSVETIKANVMELPLGYTGKYSMLLIKPHLGVHITETLSFFKEIILFNVIYKLKEDLMTFGLQDVNLTLPRCEIINWLVFNKGNSDSDFYNSDEGHFPGMSQEKVYVSSVEHQAYIKFTEEGVQAIALTPGRTSDSPRTTAGAEPFLFFILDKNNPDNALVLFNGLCSKA